MHIKAYNSAYHSTCTPAARIKCQRIICSTVSQFSELAIKFRNESLRNNVIFSRIISPIRSANCFESTVEHTRCIRSTEPMVSYAILSKIKGNRKANNSLSCIEHCWKRVGYSTLYHFFENDNEPAYRRLVDFPHSCPNTYKIRRTPTRMRNSPPNLFALLSQNTEIKNQWSHICHACPKESFAADAWSSHSRSSRLNSDTTRRVACCRKCH